MNSRKNDSGTIIKIIPMVNNIADVYNHSIDYVFKDLIVEDERNRMGYDKCGCSLYLSTFIVFFTVSMTGVSKVILLNHLSIFVFRSIVQLVHQH